MELDAEKQKQRENIRVLFDNDLSMSGIEFSIAESVLLFICKAFDMESFDNIPLSFSQSPLSIYKRNYGMFALSILGDGLELESINAMLFLLLDHELQDKVSTNSSLREIISCINKNRNNRPVSSDEYNKIIDNYIFHLEDSKFFV